MPKVELVVDGEPRNVEVDLVGGFARMGTAQLPVRILSEGPKGLELEIAGERIFVDDWPDLAAKGPLSVTVEGERFQVEARVETGSSTIDATSSPRVVASSPPSGPSDDPNAVAPPMPGRVIEVRVSDGDRVEAGAVLLVVEAMKMRNEVAAPHRGTVRDLKVRAGSAVRAREPMLRVVPD
ncbi:MAG: biotin/lipoyl-binding protein [Thermoplasmata archaeon]|nr:biotin/lipoyl-binding protein [Thermoplasmata archaeon]